MAYSFVPYGRLQQGMDAAPNPSGLGIDVHLGTVQAHVGGPSGLALDLQLPFGTLSTRSDGSRRSDTGAGDLELRARQSLQRWLRLPVKLALATGLGLPTGGYVARSGAANLAPEASYLTLGRGTTWWLFELEARLALGTHASLFAQAGARLPLARTEDGFSWGNEARGSLGARLSTPWRRVSVLASAEVLWRGTSTEPDPFAGGRVTSANAGGWFVALSPAISLALGRGLSLTVGARVPALADVRGNQLVPQTGLFTGLAYSRSLRTTRTGSASGAASASASASASVSAFGAAGSAAGAKRQAYAVPGAITVVDYWATWCKPCEEISRQLNAAAARWPDVKIVKVDASTWDPAQMAAGLPVGVGALPAVEVFTAQGLRAALLVGQDALTVVAVVDALRAGGPAQSSLPPRQDFMTASPSLAVGLVSDLASGLAIGLVSDLASGRARPHSMQGPP